MSDLFVIRNVDGLRNDAGVVKDYYTSTSDGLPLAVTPAMVETMFADWRDRMVPVPEGMDVSREWIETYECAERP